MKDNNKEVINILDIILVFLRNSKIIFVLTGISLILVLVLSISSLIIPSDSPFNLLPNIFKPQSKILMTLPGDSGGVLSSIAGSGGGIGSLLGLVGGGSLTQDVGDFVKYLFELNEIRDKIIDEFHFIDKYKIELFPITSARKEFGDRFTIEMNLEKTIVTIGFQDIDPEFATQVLNRTVELIVSKYGEISRRNISRKLIFLKESLEVTEKNYMKAQDDFIAFQKEHDIYDVTSQAKQTIVYIAELKAKLAKIELELKKLLEFYSEDDPKILRKKKEIEAAKEVIADSEKGAGIFSGQFIPKDMIPELTREFLNLQLELNIQAAIYKMLREQYEAAQIEELDTTARFQILEKGEIPEKKDHPSRVLLIIIVTFATFVFSVIIAFIREFFRNANKYPEEKVKLAEIKTELTKFNIFKRNKNKV